MPPAQRDAPASRRRPLEDLPPVLIVGLGWLGAAVTSELLQRGAPSLLLFDLDVDNPRQPTWAHEHVTWVRAERSTDEAIRDRLDETLERAGAVISCSDAPSSLPQALADLCERGRVPLIACELTDTGARLQIVNPRPPGAGCVSCESEYRARRDVVEAAIVRHLSERTFARVPWRYRHADGDVASAATFATLALADAVRAAATATAADTRAVVLDFNERTARAHPVSRHFACRRCSSRRPSTIDALKDEAQRRWASAWASIPLPRDLVEICTTLRPLVDRDYGLFERTQTSGAAERRAIGSFLVERGVKPDETPFMDSVLARAVRSRITGPRRELVVTGGFDFSEPLAAEALALIEGLERLVALDHIAPSRLVRSAYANVDRLAVDPCEIAPFSEEQFFDPRFPIRRFDPQAEMDWIWGVRIASGQPVLMPADLMTGKPPASIIHANSSGAACHSSLRHAVLNGLYEVIERDALMVTWLNQWSRPRVRLANEDPDPYGVRSAFADLSFRLTHVDVTTDVGVPVMLAVLEDERDPDLFMITMVGGLSRTRVLEKLYREITQFTYPHLVDRSQYRTPVSRSTDPADVHSLPDHLAFYQDGRKRALTAFLTASPEEQAFAERSAGEDLPVEQEIQEVVTRLDDAGYEPVVIDCTPPFLRELDLWAVKVVVPGLQPLQVGHGRAALGSRRLSGVPNPWPHPFW